MTTYWQLKDLIFNEGKDNMKLRCFGTVAAALLLAACDQCQNGREFRYNAGDDFWLQGSKDTFLDGAVRTYTFTLKEARKLELRCFRSRPDAALAAFDLRYVINVPLLKRIIPQIQKGGPVELVISVDGTPIGNLPAQSLAHDFGISFLSNISADTIDKLASAKTSIVIMPRQGAEQLDDIIEFGVADLANKIVPVKNACASAPAKN